MNNESPSQQTSLLRHIPNGITCIRILIAAIFPFCPESIHLELILIGLTTEFLDGFLARLFKWTSYLGQNLDPLADKLFVLSVSLTWVWMGKLTVLQWLLLGLRDFGVLFIVIAVILLGKIRTVRSIKARFPSKLTTALQYLAFLLVLFGNQELLMPLVLITAATGLVATIHYVAILKQSFR
jgi:cardiolipin synthase